MAILSQIILNIGTKYEIPAADPVLLSSFFVAAS